MQADLKKNYFELFELPADFTLDYEQLSARYRDLQRAVHPDRFTNASDQERRLSLQQTALINEAFQALRSPLRRGRYLLQLKGIELNDTDTTMDHGFLMEQIELREELGEVAAAADSFAALDQVRGRLERMERGFVETLAADLTQDDPAALEAARQTVRKMQFVQRLLDECGELEDRLVHAH